MTEENRRQNVTLELQRSAKALRAAEVLFKAGLYEDSVPRAFYAMLYCARALLISEGLQPKTALKSN